MAVKTYTEDEKTKGLIALVLYGGQARPASRFLKTNGVDIPESTLRNWKNRYPDRYYRLYEDHMSEVVSREVAELSDLAQAIREGIEIAADLELRRLKASKVGGEGVKDAAQSAAKLSASLKVVGDHVLALQGKPSVVVEHKSGDQYLEELAKLGLVIDGTATEVLPAAIEAGKAAPEVT